jgi:hypothetical protein
MQFNSKYFGRYAQKNNKMEFDITKLWYEFYHSSVVQKSAHKFTEIIFWLESEIGDRFTNIAGLPIHGYGWYIDLERTGKSPGIQLVIADDANAIAFKLVFGDDLET